MKCRILIVDDAPFIRDIIKHHLHKEKNFIIEEASNGNEAILKAQTFKPELILMDLALPEKNGLVASREILAHNKQIKIIALSSLQNEKVINECLDVGCVSFLAKPFDKNSLLKEIDSVIKNTFSSSNSSGEVVNG